VFVGEFDEDVFEAGSEGANFGDRDAVLQELFAEIVKIEPVFDQRMNGLAEDRRAADAGEVTREAQRASDLGRRDFDSQRAGRLDVGKLPKGIGRAVGDQFAVVNVGNVAAALGFVHVVRGDEEGDAVARKLEEQIPELASRNGIDACSGLIEEKESRLVQHGATEGEALLPSARKLRGQAIQIGLQAVELDDFFHAALEPRGLQTVDTAVELQILLDGQIVIEAEILRHVADALAHGFRILAHIEAFDVSLAAAERQEAGEHFDDGRFSAAIWTKEAEDFAFLDAEADIVDGGEVAETAHKMFGRDGNSPVRLRSCGHGFNSPLSVSRPRPCRQGRGRRDH